MRPLAVIIAAVLAPTVAFGWGFNGHRRLTANLHEPFPQGSCLRGFLAQYTSQYAFQDDSCDPDRWRGSEGPECDSRRDMPLECEGPRHYLDIDYADPISSYPREWSEVQARFGQYAVANGRVPWRVEELYGQLVDAFRARDANAVRNRVAWLSHYVTDAFSPMHDTKTQPGDLHSRYESEMLDSAARIDAITDAMRAYYGTLGRANPRDHLFDIIEVGQPLAQTLIFEDLQNRGDPAALYEHTKEMTARRWGDALTLLASVIGTAWVEADSPRLSGMPTGCASDFPQGEIVLKGYAFPPPRPPDAGVTVDAGTTEGDGGEVVVGPGSPDAPAPVGCEGCGGSAGAALLPVALLGVFRRGLRRREAR